MSQFVKDLNSCLIEIIKGLTNKEQFQYLAGLKGPQEGNYLCTTQFLKEACRAVLCVLSCLAIILMRKRGLIAFFVKLSFGVVSDL